MLSLFELFGVAFLFIWCGNGVPTTFFALHSCTWPLHPIVFKWRQNNRSTGIVSWRRIDTTWKRPATFCPVMLMNRKFDISCKLDISCNPVLFQISCIQKQTKVLPHIPVAAGGVWELIPSETKLQSPAKLNKKHYITVTFVQISECQGPLHKM